MQFKNCLHQAVHRQLLEPHRNSLSLRDRITGFDVTNILLWSSNPLFWEHYDIARRPLTTQASSVNNGKSYCNDWKLNMVRAMMKQMVLCFA